MFFLTSLITILLASRPALAAGRAFGFAAGTTGGGSATPIIPSSVAELKKLLQGDTPRVIILDKTYDFTGTEVAVSI
ncbi:unnamed protein product [Rhizoctonia solani]|uniref:Uncharacterized protein n=1 Tax=Rhizoctonia solani TaxID=456999 RepID=A0A8H3D138_9AGAM|nr:unnamed protein product [Rhizoctonia solani]